MHFLIKNSSPYADCNWLGSNPASRTASPRRIQNFPDQSASFIPVSWRNFPLPSGVPPFSEAVRLISFSIACLSTFESASGRGKNYSIGRNRACHGRSRSGRYRSSISDSIPRRSFSQRCSSSIMPFLGLRQQFHARSATRRPPRRRSFPPKSQRRRSRTPLVCLLSNPMHRPRPSPPQETGRLLRPVLPPETRTLHRIPDTRPRCVQRLP